MTIWEMWKKIKKVTETMIIDHDSYKNLFKLGVGKL